MGLSSKDAKLMHAKRRLKKGKLKEGDKEFLKANGVDLDSYRGNEFEKVDNSKFVGEPINKPLSSDNYAKAADEPTPQNPQFKQVQNSANYKENTLEGFVNDANSSLYTQALEPPPFAPENFNEIQATQEEKTKAFKIKGYMILIAVDLVAPHIIAALYKKVSKKELKADNIKLSETQKKDNEEFADAVAEKIGIGFDDPVIALSISLIICYGSNVMMENFKKEEE